MYKEAGVETELAHRAIKKLTSHFASLKEEWLPIGYFANVINVGNGIGIAITTDGVGSKALLAKHLNKYDTIGIDCVAVNVNDLICVGATPLSMVDYLAVDKINENMFDQIGVGLELGAFYADISICGGEVSQLPEIINGFDLAGTAIGMVSIDKVITGKDVKVGDKIIALGSNGVHCNGLTLSRKVLPETYYPELLMPTLIYSPEIITVLQRVSSVKALVHISGDGIFNLNRIANKAVGFLLNDMPEIHDIFKEIQDQGKINTLEMFKVFNMGIGFCIIAAEEDVDTIVVTCNEYLRQAAVIGEVIAEPGIYIPQHGIADVAKWYTQQT